MLQMIRLAAMWIYSWKMAKAAAPGALSSVPLPNGPSLQAIPLPRHRLIWLERTSAAVSGGRGWGRRIVGGAFQGVLPDNPKELIRVELRGTAALHLPDPLTLELADGRCRLHSSAHNGPVQTP